MSKDDSLAGPTFSISFAALCTLGFLFVAYQRVNLGGISQGGGAHTFEFSLSAGQAKLG